MERATQKDERGYYLVGDGIYSDEGTPEKFRGDDIDRLAAYEETGLEPEEIEKLKGEVFGLRLDKQNLEQVKQKYGEAREAIYTHCMDVPCQGESCYWWQGPEEG